MQDLKISLIQSSLAWQDRKANIKAFTHTIKNLEKNSDLIILPEMFTTGFTMEASSFAENMEGETVAWMKEMAERSGAVITGSLIIEENNCYFNRLVWAKPGGRLSTYDKRHPFSFLNEHETYTAGQEHLIETIKGWKVCPMICYDLRFPAWCRYPRDIDLFIFVANWPKIRSYHWCQLLLARAIENQAYVAGVNRVGRDAQDVNHSGDSVLIDFAGNVIQKISDREGIIHGTLEYNALEQYRQRFPFLQDRDEFKISE